MEYTESSGISEISTSSDCDLNSSIEMPKSPERILVQPRKLLFNDSPEIDKRNNNNTLKVSSPNQPSLSPPYRKVRALRLFDSPATPKTIIQKSTNATTKFMKLLSLNDEEPRIMDVLAKPIDNNAAVNDLIAATPAIVIDKPKSVPLHKTSIENLMVSANVNPFTPPAMMFRSKKRTRHDGNENYHNNSLPTICLNGGKLNSGSNTGTFVSSSFSHHRHSVVPITKVDSDSMENLYEHEMLEVYQAPKRLALQDSNISRYEKEFIEIALLGTGEFGKVYQCLNRLDGCVYAIKKSIKPVAGSAFE
jgi:wee1-like protein kinase